MEIVSSLNHGQDFNQVNIGNCVVHIYDVFGQELLNSYPNKPKVIISDHFNQVKFDTSIQLLCVPLFAERELERLRGGKLANTVTTDKCFNFIINKKQINRHLLLKLVECFNLDSYNYTWSGIGNSLDMSAVIPDIDCVCPELKTTLLCPVTGIKPNWIAFPNNRFTEFAVTEYGSNRWTWDNGINHVVETSCVSLISESVSYQRGSVFTEKTLYSVLGLTLPIWIGGYNQAQEWKNMGFDIFEDIIDHSYQACPTLVERCYRAFHDNLDILSNLESAQKTRQQLMPRLQQNRELLLLGQIREFNTKIMSGWPLEIQQGFEKILINFRPQDISKIRG